MDETVDIEKAYSQLAARHALPPYADMERHFFISSIETDSLTLKDIRHKMMDKFEYVQHILEEVLNPDATLVTMAEMRAFSEPERDGMYGLFKRIMCVGRQAVLLNIDSEEKAEAAWIRQSFIVWRSELPKLSSIVSKLVRVWMEDVDLKTRVEYLG